MEELNHLQFKNRFNIEFLPTETLLGIKLINCEILCKDKKYRPVLGVELGLIFLTLSFVNLVD